MGVGIVFLKAISKLLLMSVWLILQDWREAKLLLANSCPELFKTGGIYRLWAKLHKCFAHSLNHGTLEFRWSNSVGYPSATDVTRTNFKVGKP